MITGKLQKMVIRGFKDVCFEKPTGDSYTVLINPETYVLNYEIKTNKDTAPGEHKTIAPHVNSQPQTMEFEFLFDGTGALVSPISADAFSDMPVNEQIDLFKKTVLDINGETHQPPYVKLFWGTLAFSGRVEKIQLVHKLFKADGTPLRVIAKTSFVEVADPLFTSKETKLSSPDLTHIRTVKAGDTLPLMCYDIYGDSTLYREVARINKMINLRNLTAGQKIVFPPIEKKPV